MEPGGAVNLWWARWFFKGSIPSSILNLVLRTFPSEIVIIIITYYL